MKIGIIGVGQIGASIAQLLSAAGHEVSIANSRGPETLGEVAAETGGHPVSSLAAARESDVVVLAIQQKRVKELPADLFEGVGDDVVIIDAGNYYPRERDGRIEAIEDGALESRWVEEQIGRPVVKAFNTINFIRLRELTKPKGAEGRVALPVAGDADRPKEIVKQLIADCGYDPVDTGGLADSWRQQPGTPCYLCDQPAPGVRAALAAAEPGRTVAFTGSAESPGTFAEPR